MTVGELIEKSRFSLVNDGGNHETEISEVYCCDLLSIVMGTAPEDCAWVTIMNNINALAVAALTDCAVIILAHDIAAEEDFVQKAKQQEITVLKTEKPIFEAALEIHQML